MDRGLTRLGRELARSQEPALRDFDLRTQRARFLLQALAEPPGIRRRAPRWLACAAVAAAAALLVMLGRDPSSRPPRPLAFAIAGVSGRVGEPIASEDTPLPLAFSDGSRVALQARARARVLELADKGARVVLERGQLAARIVHRSGTRWRIDAGPFEVHVVGTAFDVSWDGAQFALALHEGAVRVAGAAIPAGRTVRAGERLVIAPGLDAQLEDARRSPAPIVGAFAPPDERALPAAGTPASPPSSAPDPRALDVQTPAPEARAGASSARRAAEPDAPSWRKLAKQGAYERAFRALADAGLELAIARASPADLLIIADVARFTRHLPPAQSALQALRTRFRRQTEAGEAAFLLGRLAFDQHAAPAEAARWFATYLEERPQGTFVREARGRMIECYQRLGDTPRAQSAAQEYLAAHPGGPHEALARAVLAAQYGDRGE